MKLKLSLALIAVVAALAMPPTADASTKPQGFYNDQADANDLGSAVISTVADNELLVNTDFILTSTSYTITPKSAIANEQMSNNANAKKINGAMVVVDQEVGLMGNSGVLGSSKTNIAKKTPKIRAHHPSARSTTLSPSTRTNDDKVITLVDAGIVNRR